MTHCHTFKVLKCSNCVACRRRNELRRLQAFVAIVEEGHITRAAERLHMQQPPLTRLLQKLEAEMGVALMERLPRGVRPTSAGLALLEEARELLRVANKAVSVSALPARQHCIRSCLECCDTFAKRLAVSPWLWRRPALAS